MTLDRRVAARIRELESRNAALSRENLSLAEQLREQGTEVRLMGQAGLEIRLEDVQQLHDYKDQNTALVEFVQAVAASKSKFGKEARTLLGQ